MLRSKRLVICILTFIVFSILLLLSWLNPVTNNNQSANTASDKIRDQSAKPSILQPELVPNLKLEQALSSTTATEEDWLDPKRLTEIIITGDVIPARGVDAKIRKFGSQFPFSGHGITELLQDGDLTIVNLESPLLNDCPVHNEGFTFCGQSSFAKAMADAGIDLVTLENNHIQNYGIAGRDETIIHLKDAGINYANSMHLDITTIHGLRIGTLAFTGVGGRFYPETIQETIKDADPKVDLLFVAFHWGKEYESIPTQDVNIAPDDPRTIARLAIQSGADMIIGNHPHWVQGIELIDGKLINYSLGNFIFDQSWSTETLQGYIGKLTYYGTKLVKVEVLPIVIKHQSQPNLPTIKESEEIMQRIKQSSLQLSQM